MTKELFWWIGSLSATLVLLFFAGILSRRPPKDVCPEEIADGEAVLFVLVLTGALCCGIYTWQKAGELFFK